MASKASTKAASSPSLSTISKQAAPTMAASSTPSYGASPWAAAAPAEVLSPKVQKAVDKYTNKNPDASAADIIAYTDAIKGGANNMTAMMAVNSARSLAEQRGYNEAQADAVNTRMDAMDAKQNERNDAIWARQEQMFNDGNDRQQAQFDQAQAAQAQALERQLAMQAALQKQAEEAALRAQVPTSTVDSSRANARRVRSAGAGRQLGRQAAMGTSQLRIPLGIQQFMSSGGSPVKLNIGM